MLFIWILPVKSTIHFPWCLTGLPLLITGTSIALIAKKMFKDSNTPILPEATPGQLHQNGLYGFSRNPMYLGIVVGLAGIAILTGLLVNLIFPLTYFIVMDKVFIKREEANLEKEFGKQYLSYKAQTRRWI